MGSSVSAFRKTRVTVLKIEENSAKCWRKNEIVLKHKKTFDTQMLCWDSTRFCLASNGNIVLYGVCEEDMALYPTIQIYNFHGDLKRSLGPPSCDHDDGCHDIMEVVTNGNKHIAVSCAHKDCKTITLCGMFNCDVTNADHEVIVAHKGPRRGFPSPGAICMGEIGTLYAVQCIEGSHSSCVYNCSTAQFEIKDILPLEVDVPCHICYVKRYPHTGIVVVSKWKKQVIAATCLSTRKPLWRLKGELNHSNKTL